jgi:hypothetical protein
VVTHSSSGLVVHVRQRSSAQVMASHHLLTNSKASGSLSTLLLMPEDETQESGAPRSHQISGVGGIESGEAFGTPAVYETAREEWVIEGYKRALVRFRSATQNREDPNLPRETFIPLFEALDLAASLIERIPDSGLPRTMRAVRYVRNRVHHQWALALRGRDVPSLGFFARGVAVASCRRPLSLTGSGSHSRNSLPPVRSGPTGRAVQRTWTCSKASPSAWFSKRSSRPF